MVKAVNRSASRAHAFNASRSQHAVMYLGSVVFALMMLLATSMTHAGLPSGINATLSMSKSTLSGIESPTITVAYTNSSSEPQSLLVWGTALEGRINEDFLNVRGADGAMPYIGRIYKRGIPSSDDYINLQPGETRSATVNLRDGYAVSQQGQYNVTYKSHQTAKQNAVHFTLLSDVPQSAFKQTPTFNSCSVSRQQEIDTALTAAETIALTARDDLQNTPVAMRSSAARYAEWFGAYDVNRWNTVQTHFNNIYSAINAQTINFDCTCTDNFFAYVYPNQPYDIYLCNAFWSAQTTGTDSKAGTIVHELSHFTIIADTDDHVYGQSGARSLADNNPAQAVDNADSHEYFAENTPFLSMPAPVAAADLIVESGSVSINSLNPGQAFTASFTVRNQGGGSAASTTLRYYLSTNSTISSGDTQLNTDSVATLAAGAMSVQSNAQTAPAAGNYWIGACVDAVSGESDTGNQCSNGVAITVNALPSPPDLVVESMSVDDTSLTPGQAFNASAIVRNTGGSTANATTLRYYRSTNSTISSGDTELNTDAVGSLSSGAQSSQSNAQIAPDEGTYWIGACVDSVSGESNTSNQCTDGVQITVTASVAGDEYEPNNTSSGASTITSGESQVHSIVPANDVDWLQFTLEQTADIVISTSGAAGDTRMWLYDSELNELAFNDDGDGTLFSRISQSSLAAGTYFIRIDEYDNDNEIAAYTVMLEVSSGGEDGDDDFLLMLIPTIIKAATSKTN